MSTGMILQTALEALAVGFIIWGFCHEDVLVRFEDDIRAAVKRRKLKVTENKNAYNKHCA